MNIIIFIGSIFLLLYALLLIYYSIAWHKLRLFEIETDYSKTVTSISIIIPARNEAYHLPALLQSLNEQSYPKEYFEVIVVDDFSTDDTAAIAATFPFVNCIQLKNFVEEGSINSYKKKAIEIGIAHSKGQLIVTTDADCVVPKNWLQTIASFYATHQPQLIVMPVSINCGLKAIEIFQALDFMSLQGITAASVHSNKMSMCNGANLAYTRKAFEAVNGFSGIDTIASGDDMLLMHKIASHFPDSIAYLKSKEVIVQTEPVNSITAFFNQRIRWASKADKYDDKRIFGVLLLVYGLNVMMLILFIASLINNSWAGVLLLFAAKTSMELFFLYPVASFFEKQKLLWFFPLAQPFHIIYTVIAGWLGKFGSYQWKERKVK